MMFVGHYAAALAAKAAEPRAPLWSYFVAAQLVDVGWGALIIAGVEKVRVDPSLPGSVFELYHMPWTHSLPAAIAWSLLGALLFKKLLKLESRTSVFIGLTIFSHWILDFIVHRPDLPLWPGGMKLGLALWNYPVPEQAIEIGMLAIGGVLWAAQRARNGTSEWPLIYLLVVLVAFQVGAMLSPPSGSAATIGASVLGVYLVLTMAAWIVDRASRPIKAAR